MKRRRFIAAVLGIAAMPSVLPKLLTAEPTGMHLRPAQLEFFARADRLNRVFYDGSVWSPSEVAHLRNLSQHMPSVLQLNRIQSREVVRT